MIEPIAYLSGAIAGKTLEQASDWRTKAANLLDLRGWGSLNPMRGKEHIFSPGEVLPFQDPRKYLSSDSVILTRDLLDIEASKALLVYVGYDPNEEVKPLTGTVCEVFAAKYMYYPSRPCIAFKNEGDGVHPQVHSPWFGQFFVPRYKVFPNLSEAIDFMVSCF